MFGRLKAKHHRPWGKRRAGLRRLILWRLTQKVDGLFWDGVAQPQTQEFRVQISGRPCRFDAFFRQQASVARARLYHKPLHASSLFLIQEFRDQERRTMKEWLNLNCPHCAVSHRNPISPLSSVGLYRNHNHSTAINFPSRRPMNPLPQRMIPPPNPSRPIPRRQDMRNPSRDKPCRDGPIIVTILTLVPIPLHPDMPLRHRSILVRIRLLGLHHVPFQPNNPLDGRLCRIIRAPVPISISS